MKNKIRVLKVLESINTANSKIEGRRLEQLVNTNLFNKENDSPIWGGELLELLKDMKEKNEILQDNEKKYSITQKGIDYLKEHGN